MRCPVLLVRPSPLLASSLVAALFVLFLGAGLGQAEPKMQIKLAAFPGSAFPNFSALSIPTAPQGALEIWLEDALADVQLPSVRITLNDASMTSFVSTNPLPRGTRAIVRLGATINPEYSLRLTEENVLSFSAMDAAKNTYTARFYLTYEPNATEPRLIGSRAPAGVSAVTPPPAPKAPVVRFTSEWPQQTNARSLVLNAEVTDTEGLHRIVIEINGKDAEEALIENGRVVRLKNGFIARSKPAGEITGDEKRLTINLPVEMDKAITVVAVRAENALGLRTRIDRVVRK